MEKERKLSTISHRLENIWEKHSIVISLSMGVSFAALHYFGFIANVRFVIANVVNFASIVIGVTGVFLTLLITLKESPVFIRIRNFFPNLQKKIYVYLRNQIYLGLAVVILSLMINLMPPPPYKILASLGVLIWAYFFWKMSIGAFFTVKILTDLIVRNFDVSTRKIRK